MSRISNYPFRLNSNELIEFANDQELLREIVFLLKEIRNEITEVNENAKM